MENIAIRILKKQFSINDLKQIVNIEQEDILYIGGSVVEGEYNELSFGMGNPKSDLDLFIIKDSKSYETIDCEYEFSNRKVDFGVVNGIDFDIEFFMDKDINNIVKCLDNINYDVNERVDNMITLPNGWKLEDINELLTRIYYARCIYNEEAFFNLKKRLQFNSFSKIYRDFTINKMENIIDDVLGNLEVGQLETALYSSRNAFLYFMKFIILSENEFIDRDKWIILKFFNIVKQKNKYEDVAEKFRELFLKDVSDSLVLVETVKNAMNFIQRSVEDMMVGDLL